MKFRKMFTGRGNRQRRRWLRGELLVPGGPLYDCAWVDVIGKCYFVVAKLVDLPLGEWSNVLGYGIVSDGMGWQLASDVAAAGPQTLGR
jgi:hypothetical protein